MPIADTLRSWLRFGKPDGSPDGATVPASASSDLDQYTISFLTEQMRRWRPEDVRTVLEEAAQGYCHRQAELFSDIQDKDAALAAHIQTRKLAVVGCPWSVSSKKHADIAEKISIMLRAAGVRGALMHLMDAIVNGYSGAVVDWEEGGKSVKGFKPVQPEAFEFDYGGNIGLRGVTGAVEPLWKFHPAQFVLARAESRPGIPSRNGLLRTLSWVWLFKNVGWRNWARFIEKFGIPFVVGKMADQDFKDKEKRNIVLNALRRLGPDGAGVSTQSTEVQFLNAVQSGNVEAFKAFCAYCDDMYALAVLGQLASSDKASGWSKGSAQDKVRLDLLEADAGMLADAMQRCVINPLCAMAYGLAAHDIEFCIDPTPPDDLKGKAEMLKVLAEASGKDVAREYIEAEFGIQLSDKPAQPAMPTLVDLADTATTGQRRERALQAITDEALRRTVDDPEALAQWTGPVAAAIRQAFGDLSPDAGVDEFRARIPKFLEGLPGILSEMDSSKFERHLSGAMLSAALNGYLTPLVDKRAKA